MKKKPEIKLQLISERIGPVKADKQVRDAIKKIVKFWNKNKHNSNLEIPAQIYDHIIKCGGIRAFRKLRTKWTCDLSQDIKAYYSADCVPQLKRALKEYIAKKV